MGPYQQTVLLGARLVYPVWQIYSTTRISTLIAVILTLVNLNYTGRYNCEVRMFYICFICGCDLTGHDPKVEAVLQFVSKPFYAPNLKGNKCLEFLLFLD
jgi:hypothetical protein